MGTMIVAETAPVMTASFVLSVITKEEKEKFRMRSTSTQAV